MSNWLNHHLQAIKLVLSRLFSARLSTFMISLVIAVALALPGMFYLVVDNLSHLTDRMQNETEISLFLKLDTSQQTVAAIDATLAKNNAIHRYRFVSKDEAWQQLQDQKEENADISNAINQLGKNPLPDAFFIQPKTTDPEQLEALRSTLQQLDGVEQALLNAEWAKRLASLLNLGKKFVLTIALLLAGVLLVIIGNTVRMQILTQKDEIEVSYLIGATNSFIRVPFLYAGACYGMLGGILASLMIAGIVFSFNHSIAEISRLYGSDFSLQVVNLKLCCTMIAGSIGIGWLGSYLAVSRAIQTMKSGQF